MLHALTSLLVLAVIIASAAPRPPVLARMTGELDVPSAPASAGQDSVKVLSDGQDFSEVDDPLGGKRLLLDAADLVVMDPAQMQSSSSSINLVTETRATSNGLPNGTGKEFDVETKTCDRSDPTFDPVPFQVRPARLFDQAADVLVDIRMVGNNCNSTADSYSHKLTMRQGLSGTTLSTQNVTGVNSLPFQIAVADFTDDGFDDILVLTTDHLYGATAKDVSDTSGGLTIGAKLAFGSNASLRFVNDPAVADLDGDGLVEVAQVMVAKGVQIKLEVFTVCPGSVSGTVCAGASALDVKSRTTIDLSTGEKVCGGATWGGESYGGALAVAAGTFGGDTGVVVVTSSNSSGKCNPVRRHYRFDTSLKPTLVATDRSDTYFNEVDATFVRTARLDWFSGEDQLVWAVYGHKSDNDHKVKSLNVLTFASSGAMTNHRVDYTDSETDWLMPGGVDTGVFGELTSSDTDASDYNPRIALLVYSHDNTQNRRIETYTWDASKGTLTEVGSTNLATRNQPADRFHSYGGNRLHAVDLQSRSVRVGEPEVLRLDSTQAQMTVGAPPMHVDYVQTVGKTAPTVFNFSAIPDTFTANYATTSGGTITQSTENDNSWSMEGKETVSVEAKTTGLTSMLAAQAGFNLKQTFSQTKSNEVDETYGSTQSYSVDLTYATALDDVVYYTNQRVNTYHYPVLGKTTCADGSQSCTDPIPMYYAVSMVDDCQSDDCQDVTSAVSGGASQEWYQPVHEPGQLFSYPWNRTQLTARFPDADYVTPSDVPAFFTNNTPVTENVSWTTDTVSSKTTTSSHGWGSDTSLSMYYGTPKLEDEVAGGKVSTDLDFSYSSATKTVNVSNSSTSASRGISVSQPGTFKSYLNYAYSVQGNIFGQSTPDGTFDLQTQTADIATSGTLQAAFTANPLAGGAGSWWSGSNAYKTYFDVGLNHPARWTVSAVDYGGQTTDPDDCARQSKGGTALDCAEINQPISGDWWNSEFYWMKGLLIASGTGDAANGQSRAANDGDTVSLQARVYNYSMKDMGTNKIHVRFYRQQWDDSSNTPTGTSTQIGSDVVLSGLPAFGNASNSPNWTTASTTWDTTGQGGTYWVFWVLAYAVDTSGNLLAELPGHGLSAKPGTLTSIFDAPLEEVTITLDDGTSETVSFSNNVGFLRSDFYVAPESGTLAAQASARKQDRPGGQNAPAQTGKRELAVRNLKATPARAALGKPIIIEAEIHALDAEVQGIPVDFFDGPPSDGRRFESEHLAWIEAGESHHVSAIYRAKTCGPHVVTVVAAPRHHITAREVVSVDVECPRRTFKVWLPVAERHDR